MKNIYSISLRATTKEELLPNFSQDFPYIATQAELNRYSVPWHWHPAIELFYMESGTLEYTTPSGKWVFPTGSGGNFLGGLLLPHGVNTILFVGIIITLAGSLILFLTADKSNRII